MLDLSLPDLIKLLTYVVAFVFSLILMYWRR